MDVILYTLHANVQVLYNTAMVSLDTIRQFYADEIQAVANLQSAALVEALASVARERFLGPGPWDVAVADPKRPGAVVYRKTRTRIRATSITTCFWRSTLHASSIMAILGRSLRASTLSIWPLARRFSHVGCGAGYYTALAAVIVGSAGRVVGIEIDEELAARAKENLSTLNQVTVRSGDATIYKCDPV